MPLVQLVELASCYKALWYFDIRYTSKDRIYLKGISNLTTIRAAKNTSRIRSLGSNQTLLDICITGWRASCAEGTTLAETLGLHGVVEGPHEGRWTWRILAPSKNHVCNDKGQWCWHLCFFQLICVLFFWSCHSWIPTQTWPSCSLRGIVDPHYGGRQNPSGVGKGMLQGW